MKKVSSTVVKKRSRELTTVFESFTPYSGMEGRVERIWITEIATDGIHLVGHTKGYIQVLVSGPESMLGSSAMVKITSVGRWSVFGEVIKILNQKSEQDTNERNPEVYSSCSNLYSSSACSKEPESCACGTNDCCGKVQLKEITASIAVNEAKLADQTSQNPIHWLLRKRKNYSHKVDGVMLEDKGKQSSETMSVSKWGAVDKALLGGIVVSLLTIFALFLFLGSKYF